MELISKEYLTEMFAQVMGDCTCPLHIAAEIDQIVELAPTIDAVPVVHAKWIDAREYCGDYMCSNCDALYGTNKFKYCPNCGAKMDLEDEDE